VEIAVGLKVIDVNSLAQIVDEELLLFSSA